MATKFEDLPPQVQNQLRQMQQFQQQLELVVQQRLQLDARLNETKNAVEELEKLEEDAVIYKSIGNLIIRGKKDKVLKNLKEDNETTELRKKSLESQETKIKEKIDDLQKKLQDALKQPLSGST